MSTKFLVDRVLPGNLPPVSVCRSFFGTKFAELAAMFGRPDCSGLAVIHHYLTVKQCAIQSTNQAFALLSSPVSCPMETMADLNPLSPHHRPMMNDHLWSMVCCKAWLHCSQLPTQLFRILQTRDYSTLHSFLLSYRWQNFAKTKHKKICSDQKLAHISKLIWPRFGFWISIPKYVVNRSKIVLFASEFWGDLSKACQSSQLASLPRPRQSNI